MIIPGLKYAAFFGGARDDKSSPEYLETVEMAKFLAEQGYIIKNSGYLGIMEAASKGALLAGGKVIGVTCKEVGPVEGNKYLTETIVTQTLNERLDVLLRNTDLFIVQLGGIGTFSELFLALDIVRKMDSIIRPKIYLIGEVWEEIMHIISTTFLPAHEHGLWKILKGVEELEIEIKSL